jgi:DNA-binding CsgD family transcriptional regulator
MLPGGYTSVLQSKDRSEFRAEIVRFTQRLGFETVSAVTIIDRGMGKSDFIHVDNTPSDYVEPYSDPGDSRRDPVLAHCKRQSVPIIWDRQTYVNHGAVDLWEHQATFGYCTGIAMALHLPEGKHFLLGVDRDQPCHRTRGNCSAWWPTCSCLPCTPRTPPASAAAQGQQPERPALTPRELEALRWTMEGKTAWEVGAVLGITERTAVLHVNNAMHKLGCVNKHQAVLKALRLGLIH